jgi:hypothetical protein
MVSVGRARLGAGPAGDRPYVMPRLSTKARVKQKWFRFKKWLRYRLGPKPKLAWDSPCTQCGSEVLWGADTRVEGNTLQ